MAITQTGSKSDFPTLSTAASGTVSAAITVPADAEIVVAALSGFHTAGADNWTGMTFTKGGVDTPMTKISRTVYSSQWNCTMFYLALPDTGSGKTLKWAWTGTSGAGEYVYSVTFWKGIDTSAPARDSDAANGTGWPRNTVSLTALSGDKIVAFAGFFYATGNGAGDVTAWNNLTELGECTNQGISEGAWATGDPTTSTTVGVQSCTGGEGGIVALVLKPAATVGIVVTLTAGTGALVLTGRAASLRIMRVSSPVASGRATELLAQYERKIAKVGQWIAVRRYVGTGGVRTYTDTPAKAYMTYKPAKEFVGAVVQNYAVVIALADTLSGLTPQISTNDKLVTAFGGFDDLSEAPDLNEDSHVSGGKESAIFSIMKRAPSGKLIAYEIFAVG